MATDWQLIRRLVDAALDACEALDRLEIQQEELDTLISTDGRPSASVLDGLLSAHTYPENLRYTVIRARDRLGEPAPFVPPLSRVLQQVGALSAELVGARQLTTPVRGADPFRPNEAQSMAAAVEELATWYQRFLVPGIHAALTRERGAWDNTTTTPGTEQDG